MRFGRGSAAAVGALLAVALLGAGAPAEAAPVPTARAEAHGPGGLERGGHRVAPNTAGLAPASARVRARVLGAGALPAASSLERWTVAPGDQGRTNACVAWAIGHAMLGWYSLRSGSTRTFAPMYVYSQDHRDGDGGSTSVDAYAILTTQGIAPRSGYSRGATDWRHLPSDTDRRAAAAHTTTAPHYLYNLPDSEQPGAAGRRAIEAAVVAQHPVALGVPIFPAFTRLDRARPVLRARDVQGSVPDGAHMVLVVGYSPAGVRVQNSWGAQWGAGGFATLGWDFVERWSFEASWIAGFARDAPATAPAQVDAFATRVSVDGGTAAVHASWHGTGEYDDAVRHPVTGHTAALTPSDGSAPVRADLAAEATSVDFGGLDPALDYTLSVAATNVVGTGAAQVAVLRPASTGSVLGAPVAAPPLASPAPAPAARTPAVAAAEPGLRWPHLVDGAVVARWQPPLYTGHSAVDRYRVTVLGRRGGRTVASRTVTVPASARSARLPFRSAEHAGARFVPRSLPGYVVRVQAHTRSGRWGAVLQTTTAVRWSSRGWSTEARLG